MSSGKRVRIPEISPKPSKNGNIFIRFRLTLNGEQKHYRLSLPFKWSDKRERHKAQMIADNIRSDITNQLYGLNADAFDPTLEKYRGGKRKSQPKKNSKNLLDAWLSFVAFKVKEGKIQETTRKKHYSDTEKVLDRVQRHDPELLKPESASKFLAYLSDHYKPSTLVLYYKNWSACANWAVKRGIWDKNPYSSGLSELKGQCQPANSGKAYSDTEVSIILRAIADNRFTSKYACIKHSYYHQFLKFLFLTGVRPQLAIALEWEQISWKNGQPNRIYFDRAYTNGILKPSKGDRKGKNTPRVFPVNKELAELISSIPKSKTIRREPIISKHLTHIARPHHPNLIFPSPRGWYIDIGNFTTRTFSTVVEKLVELGEVKEYLSTYHARHTVQNRWLEAGVSEQDISALLDTSPEMIRRHYRDDRRYFEGIAQRNTLPKLKPE